MLASKVSDFETRTNMRKKPDRAEFECLQNYESAEHGVILSIMKNKVRRKILNLEMQLQNNYIKYIFLEG